MPRPKSHEITVAVIGLIGVLATAIISNFSKWFGPPQLAVAYQYKHGYKSSRDFDAAVRYLMDVSGTRRTLEAYLSTSLTQISEQGITEHPDQAQNINDVVKAARAESSGFIDLVIDRMLPIYHKYYTLDQIEELNRFYSTDVMQTMVANGPRVSEDVVKMQPEVLREWIDRIERRMPH